MAKENLVAWHSRSDGKSHTVVVMHNGANFQVDRILETLKNQIFFFKKKRVKVV